MKVRKEKQKPSGPQCGRCGSWNVVETSDKAYRCNDCQADMKIKD